MGADAAVMRPVGSAAAPPMNAWTWSDESDCGESGIESQTKALVVLPS